ncbi:MAG: hypothetical protein NTX29_09740 [Actinobacteria bacterium]|nr:hypothetical protein [Actinomycetota bacterium]
MRRIYVVFQDLNWTARPWTILDQQVRQTGDAFEIELTARGTFDAAPFIWTGRITGAPDGTTRYAIDGTAERSFVRNRLGMCVLHPADLAGRAATLERIDGTLVKTAFPDSIDPDQPFADMRALTHEVTPGLLSTVRMTGETFESEDHRNWSDASFKHYCTPITLPFPVTVHPGERIAQAVEISLTGSLPEAAASDRPLRIDITDETASMPALGIQLDHDGHALTPTEIERLAALRLAHVRVDLTSDEPVARMEGAVRDAEAIGALLIPAITVTSGIDHLAPFADDPRISHWLVFDPNAKVTGPELLEHAHGVLGERIGGGTNLYFTELNRGRPAGPGRIAFSLNPQVHAADDQTVMQNAATQGTIARNARRLYPDAFLEVSPITLRPRFNPNATQPDLDVSNTPLPSRVDARQCGTFAAAWTVLSLKALAESGCIDAVTYFQATGWEGVMERAEGSPQPDDFPSAPGMTYPVYDVFAAVAGATRVTRAVSSHPDLVDALVVDDIVLVANASPEPQVVTVGSRTVTLDPYGIVTIEREA